ncbi:MAG: hypothetical protein ACR2PA_18560, partial [Hyphomicrobiaceae bacterium]
QALVATVVGLSEAEPRASEPAEPRKRSFVKTAAGLAASIVIAALALQLPGMQDWQHLPPLEKLIEQVGNIHHLLA